MAISTTLLKMCTPAFLCQPSYASLNWQKRVHNYMHMNHFGISRKCAIVGFYLTCFIWIWCNYRIVGFFKVLKFREWLIFGFFTILFSRMGLPKAHTLQWVVGFFEGLNFTNDQHPRNLQNLRTSKKPTIRYKVFYCKTP